MLVNSIHKPNFLLSKTIGLKHLSLVKKCVSIKQLQQAHTQMLVNSIHKPNFLLSKTIGLKHFSCASHFFSHIPQPNDYAFNVMICGLTTTWLKYSLALDFYYCMKFLGLKPNNFYVPFYVHCVWKTFAINHGWVAHLSVFKVWIKSFKCENRFLSGKLCIDEPIFDDHTYHSLITVYARCGELSCARKVFDEITERDLVSWNSMISGDSKMGYAGDAVGLFQEMRGLGFEPDEMTLVSVLGACGDLGDLSLGRWVEGFVVENKMELNSYVGSALIDMYGKCGDLVAARRVFDSMAKKDVVTWNAMITGYAQNGMSDESIMLFNGMNEAGVDPDKITLIGVLSSCASIGALDIGKWVDTYASERGLHHDIYVGTALIDMYAKCGNLDNALRVSWNAMISALAFHGQAQAALSLFKRMTNDSEAACPNDITFVAVLSACVHAGLVDEGCSFFDMMSSSFGLVPKIEHYSCMVDLLARAGRLYEAWDFIEKMPEKPDEVALGALLGACHKRRNVDISQRVVQLLLELETLNSGNYVISSKIFANLKRWDDSARMRVLMRQRGVMKTPGCSFRGTIDPMEGVHFMIKILFFLTLKKMKDEGFAPVTT
ncbi:hypothetical protein RGQ29_006814 [Quercus rubra]|uniref:Pentatricopeptide repeat-containing protein n=1 Tax=Quercus rubra TaxID=3512 RepID=A0AAN7E957_QUERU|nr:hypothetical protein RGQ29_006814 [Quercus rubra]